MTDGLDTVNQTEVVIVGAGLAGITAALNLVEQGIDVVVLEARNRIGGRVHGMVNEQGIQIDLGAQWVGSSMKRIHRLMKQEGIHTLQTSHKGKSQYFLASRRLRGRGDMAPLSPLFFADYIQMLWKWKKSIKHISPGEPWNSPLAKELDAQSMEAYIEKNAYTKAGKAFWRTFVTEALCLEPSEVSVLDFFWCITTNGSLGNALATEKKWMKEGAFEFACRLAVRLGERVRLNAPVRAIRYESSCAWVRTDKEVWKAKRVIVAIPPVLTGQIMYTPPMPAKRVKLTGCQLQGSVFKCILTYNRPFWREEGYSGIGYYDEGPVQATMDSSPPDRPEGVLIAFAGGNEARRLSLLTKVERKNSILNSLVRFFGNEAMQVLSYEDLDWSAEEWSQGGYSAHFSPGLLISCGPILYEPVGPIHWAGTETATEYRLYMEGAIQSGERAAKEVLTLIQA
jgi:monoamine oxidase